MKLVPEMGTDPAEGPDFPPSPLLSPTRPDDLMPAAAPVKDLPARRQMTCDTLQPLLTPENLWTPMAHGNTIVTIQVNDITHAGVGQLLEAVGNLAGMVADHGTVLRQVTAALTDVSDRLADRTKDYYSVKEVAELTKRSEYTVRRWIEEGRLEAEKIQGTGAKGKWRIPREAVKQLTATCQADGDRVL